MGLANYKEMLTVIVVTYHSDKIVERLLNAIEKDIQILVVENSLNEKLKTNLEKKFENVTVLIPRENLGNGGGIWDSEMLKLDTLYTRRRYNSSKKT